MTPVTSPALLREGPVVEGRTLTVVVLDVAVVAWLALAFLHAAPLASPAAQPQHTGHHQMTPGNIPLPGLDGPALWLSGWACMVVAMMLPPALPLLRVARRLTVRRAHPGLLTTTTALAFLSVWLLAGICYVAGGELVQAVTGRFTALQEHPQVLSGLAALAAGAYQFTPFKRACLDACRSPLSLAMTSWTGARPGRDAAKIGVRFGLVCVGCCWALMLLTFVVGVAAMPVMVIMAAVMALERLLPRFRPVVPFVGVGALVLGVLLLAGVVPPGLTS